MGKRALATIVLLLLTVVIVLGLLVQSRRHAAGLEARIITLERERTDAEARVNSILAKVEAKEAAVRRINQEIVVTAGATENYRFSPPAVPGTLTGTWRSSGRGFGGINDDISGFRLMDPTDAPLESSQRGSSGRFFVKVSARGPYTFFFDNKGLVQTPRRVFLEAEFKPD
jgi:hypothetical protein